MANLLNISEAANLALHTMVYLVGHGDRRVSAREVAEAYGASEAHLAKVLQRLGKAGLVDSARGPKGGFVLAREPGRVTLLEVLEAVDGPMFLRDCLFAKRVCHGTKCIFGDTLKQANRAFRDHFRKTRLSAFAGENGKRG